MTPADIARELLRLSEAATPGPWMWNELEQITGPPLDDDEWNEPIVETDCRAYGPRDNDRDLILFCRNHAPALARAYLEMEADRDALRASLAAARGALRSVEWNGRLDTYTDLVREWVARTCPACGDTETAGHASGCRLAAALREEVKRA